MLKHHQGAGRSRCRDISHSFFLLRVTIAILLPFLLSLNTCTTLAMRLVVQRVKSASVTVDGAVVSSIGPGAMALVGLHQHDTIEDLEYCCKRLLACKLWENDSGGSWRHGVKQRGLEVLCVSQFTLYGTLSKKHQPDYKLSMKSVPAREMYQNFLDMLKSNYEADKIKDGVFGAMMDVALVNDGPVTIVIESEPKAPADDGDSETPESLSSS
jgi:D-tyrosyl-tRNA(Tyr) deacylase